MYKSEWKFAVKFLLSLQRTHFFIASKRVVHFEHEVHRAKISIEFGNRKKVSKWICNASLHQTFRWVSISVRIIIQDKVKDTSLQLRFIFSLTQRIFHENKTTRELSSWRLNTFRKSIAAQYILELHAPCQLTHFSCLVLSVCDRDRGMNKSFG